MNRQDSLRNRIWRSWLALAPWPRLGARVSAQAGEPELNDDDSLPIESRGYPPIEADGYFQLNSTAGNPLPIQLSLHTLDRVVRELAPFLGGNCPICVIYDKPAQIAPPAEVVQATLATIRSVPGYAPHIRSAFILVG
jgi:hypothetical protein